MVTQSAPRCARCPPASKTIGRDPARRDDAPATLVHASAVRLSDKGILLLGPSASGKSDLALRLIDAGAVLIADDQVRLMRHGDQLHAGPPERLAGLLALRGIGIMRVPFVESRLDLAVDLLPSASADDPLPEPASESWLDIDLPKIGLDPTSPSAVARIKMVLSTERIY